jgi:signal transduction histidine kinase
VQDRLRGALVGIRARLAFVLLVASLPAVGIFGAYEAYRFQQEKQNAIEQLQQRARSIASTRGLLLDQTEALLQSLAGLPQLRNMRQDPRACGEVLARTLKGNPQYANIAAADMDGWVICRGAAVAPPKPVNVADRAWFQRLVARRTFVVGNYAVGRASGESSIHTAYPVFDDNQNLIGAVNAGIRLSWLEERFAALELPPGFVVALVDSDGTVLLRHPRQEGKWVGEKKPQAARLIAEQGRGVTDAQMLDGVFRTMAFEPLGGLRWDGITVVAAAEPSYIWNVAWRLIGIQASSFALVLLVSVLAAVLGAYWMVVRPVRLLQEAVDGYAAGNRSARADETDRGELGHLAGAFNAMAERLNRQERELREASAQKSRYLAIASHDLRQPLQVAMMGLDTGIENSEGKVRTSLERGRRAAERLEHQLDLLAEVVRSDFSGTAGARPAIHAVPISELFRRLAEAHQQTAAAKGLRLHFVESSLAVASDTDALSTILNNLVMNAINYTARGRVVVGCRRAGKVCRIEVHDTGSGIPPESLARIFEAFQRLQPGIGTGLGLGLTIAKDTAFLLGHALVARSEPGKGSCFGVEVPIWNRPDDNEQSAAHR